jgi:hypothetical protein
VRCHEQGLHTRTTAIARSCDIDTLEKILASADLPSCVVDDMMVVDKCYAGEDRGLTATLK